MIDIIAAFPVLVAADLNAQKTFYERYFGFEAVFLDADFYLHLLHRASGSQLAFMVPGHASQPDFLQPPAGTDGMVISLEVRDAAAARDTAVREGLTFALDFKVEPFGQTHFMVEDPAGFVVDVVENHAD